MKKYTNKILIITAIVLVLGIVIGYTIDFQTGYRNGRIKYEKSKFNPDSLTMVIREALNDEGTDTSIVEMNGRASLQEENCSDAQY